MLIKVFVCLQAVTISEQLFIAHEYVCVCVCL